MVDKNGKIGTGQLLLAEPFMEDKNFKRSVVLLTDHDDLNGTVGFIVNKFVKVHLNELLEDFPKFEANVYYGGPVQTDSLHFVHNIGDKLDGGVEIRDGIFWGGNFETLKVLIENNQVNPWNFKFFLGYSGWDVGQLEIEMNEHSWIITDAVPQYVLEHTSINLWKKILYEMGGKYKMMASYPEHPSLN